MGDDPFGENVSLFDGNLTFQETDIDLAGNGPRLQLIRTLGKNDIASPGGNFADWNLEIPHIETLSADINATQSNSPAGTVPHWFFSQDANRCSNLQTAPSIFHLFDSGGSGGGGPPQGYTSNMWWHGYTLAIPGMDRQDMLLRDSTNNTLSPQMTQPNGSAYTFSIVTKKNWQIACLPQTSNGAIGEGFLVVAPDGTKYWMDWLVSSIPARSLGGGQDYMPMFRVMDMMMTSRVEDRFGNSLTYTYNSRGDLTTITASDGRQLTLNYGNSVYLDFITSAVVQSGSGPSRTWSYGYDSTDNYLTSVLLPDGSNWSFNLSGVPNPIYPIIYYNTNALNGTAGCIATLNPQPWPTATETIRHPSGLLGTFTLESNAHGRSNVPYECTQPYGGGVNVLGVPNLGDYPLLDISS